MQQLIGILIFAKIFCSNIWNQEIRLMKDAGIPTSECSNINRPTIGWCGWPLAYLHFQRLLFFIAATAQPSR